MSDKALLKKSIDRDLMVLDELSDECTIESRNWESIINIYNQHNRPFPIKPLVCSKIVENVKKGLLPDMIFKEYGISYTAFKNRFNKTKQILEELAVLPELTEAHWEIINTCRNDPAFILGSDIERAVAHHFNKCTENFEMLASVNAQSYEKYLAMTHPEHFSKKENEKNLEVVIKIAPGLLDN